MSPLSNHPSLYSLLQFPVHEEPIKQGGKDALEENIDILRPSPAKRLEELILLSLNYLQLE